MERLNDIMQRSTQRRQQTANEERESHSSPSQGQRREASLPRRPLREQTAHLGQVSHSSRQILRSAQDGNVHTRAGQAHAPTGEQPGTREASSLQQSRTFALSRDRGYSPMVQADVLPIEPADSQGRRASDVAGSHFQVQEEWAEDDTADMRYGDWESDGSIERMQPPGGHGPKDPGAITKNNYEMSRAAMRISQTPPPPNRQPVSRELRTRSDAKAGLPSPYITRNLREAQMAPAHLPVPQSPPREAVHAHRLTQPLHPQSVVHMSQDIPPQTNGPGTQKPAPRPQNGRRDQAIQRVPYAPTSSCSICKGAGYLRADVPYGHPNFGKPIPCECKEAERKEKRRWQLQEMSNLGAFYDKSFENFDQHRPGLREAFQVAYEFAQNRDGWLLLIGPNGCGKTHLAAAIANQSLSDGALVLFATVPDLLDHLRAAFAPTSTEVYDQLFSRMREAEVLVLDDLGVQQSSPWANEKLFQLLNYRYNSRFPTVITANNVGLQGIDERIRSRMEDASLVTKVTFDGARDYRPNKPWRE